MSEIAAVVGNLSESRMAGREKPLLGLSAETAPNFQDQTPGDDFN